MKTSPNFKSNLKKQRKFSAEELAKLDKIEQEAIARFVGDLSELESALGMLKLGYQFGWRALYLVHSKATVRKYEEILNISVRDMFLPEGPGFERLNIAKLLKTIKNFWKVVSGEEKVSGKRTIE